MSEDTFHFSVCLQGDDRKYVNGSCCGCPIYRTHEPGGVYNAALCYIR